MKIMKYKKGKKNTYIVTIDSNEYTLYDDVIISYSLLLKKEITKQDLESVLKMNKSLDCYYKSLDYLNKKMRSKKELKDYLLKKEFSLIEINETIEKLVKENYLNEESYVKAFINDEICFSNDGPNKIKSKLINLGLDGDLVSKYLGLIDDKVWIDKCFKLISKKEKSNHKDSRKVLEIKIKQYLLHNGYDNSMIIDCLAKVNFQVDTNDVKKEYEKIRRKLAKKYDGSALDYQVNLKMRSKGFTMEDLENIK